MKLIQFLVYYLKIAPLTSVPSLYCSVLTLPLPIEPLTNESAEFRHQSDPAVLLTLLVKLAIDQWERCPRLLAKFFLELR